MPKYKLTLEYDGTGLCGFQRQKGQVTTQGLLEDALKDLFDEIPKISVSGRTDAGVHAYGQVVSFEISKNFKPFTLMKALNHRLIEKPLIIVDCEIVNDDFDARFSSKKRYYKYVILNRPIASVIDKNRAWHITKKLDITQMQEATKYLIGKHDFSSFRSSECQGKSPIKTLDEIRIETEGDYIYLYFTAQSFLHHMVRNLVGTIKEVGLGNITPQNVKTILEAKDRRKAKQTAPAYGLYFMKVDY